MQRKAPGTSIRAGDFAKIIVADYVEYIIDTFIRHHRPARLNKIGGEHTPARPPPLHRT